MNNLHEPENTSDDMLAKAHKAFSNRQFEEAHKLCMQVLKVQPTTAEAYFILALIAMEFKNYSKAEDVIRRAIRFRSDKAEYYTYQAQCLLELNQQDLAIEAVGHAAKLSPTAPHTLDTIGVIYSRLNLHTRALVFFDQAVELTPDNEHFQYNLASSLQFLGEFDRAEQSYEAAIALQPLHYRSHSAISQLRKQTTINNHIDRLKKTLDQCQENIDGQLHICHALAKEHEDLGEFGRAMHYLREGNQKKKKSINYQLSQDQRLFDTLHDIFSQQTNDFQFQEGYQTNEPIFILGMPRSGTTLIERILSNHPSVKSAGELTNFSLQLKRMTNTASNLVLDVETLQKAVQLDFKQLGSNYLDSTRRLTGSSKYFIDKMPLNFMYAGFIRQALPQAKIICLQRNPMDTCLSNFRQLFATSFSFYNYAYDLEDTAHYCVRFEQLMKLWERILGDGFYRISYESMIANPEQETRKLLAFCDLPWDSSCLDFEQNSAPVATASSVQVREKIYTRAVNRWKKYEDSMTAVQRIFDSAGIIY